MVVAATFHEKTVLRASEGGYMCGNPQTLMMPSCINL